MQNGGCHPVDGCSGRRPVRGRRLRVPRGQRDVQGRPARRSSRRTGSRSSRAASRSRFVGMTLEGTTRIGRPAGIAAWSFFDEADTANALVPELKRQGVETIVVLLHEGGVRQNPLNRTHDQRVRHALRAIVAIVKRMDDEIDVVVTGHTNWAVQLRRSTARSSRAPPANGRLITDIDLTVSRATERRRRRDRSNNRHRTRDRREGAATHRAHRRSTRCSRRRSRTASSAASPPTSRATDERSPASRALGDVIADAQLAATDDPGPVTRWSRS